MRSRTHQRGQALVEFAFGMVVLLVLMTGLLDVSRAFHYTIGLEGAVRAGARHGIFFQIASDQQPYLDDTDIKAAVDQVLSGDGLNSSTLKASSSCLSPTDSNSAVDPPYPSSAYPTTTNTPYLYLCYDSQGSHKSGTKTSPPSAGDTTYAGTDLVVILLDRYGLIGGLSSEYLSHGASLTGLQLTAFQHFSVQG
jgi:Flp pilus assembly protein TadG